MTLADRIEFVWGAVVQLGSTKVEAAIAAWCFEILNDDNRIGVC